MVHPADSRHAIRTDGTNAFARYSMEVRVPKIARDTLARNPEAPASVRQAVLDLAAAIERDEPIPAPRPPILDTDAWERAYDAHAGERWLSAEWFYAELTFYREMLAAFRYWETGLDPFEPFKDEEIAADRLWQRLARVQGLARGSREERVHLLLDGALWANRVDLSYTVAAMREHAHEADFLVDDRAKAVPLLAQGDPDLHLVADNAGTELCLDLALVDAVLEAPRSRATLHLKIEPTFVSDAMPKDVWRLCDAMAARGGEPQALAARLRTAFGEGRLRLRPDPFWSGPGFLEQAPPRVVRSLERATIVVFKGDANYRRVVRDRLWAADAPFSDACGMFPFPLLCLRTMKSDALLGLPPGLAPRLDAEEPRWRIDGQRGVAQLHLG